MTAIVERMGNSMNIKNIGIGLAVLALVVAGFFLPVQEWAEAYQAWLEDLGWIGWVAYVLIYAFATILIIPGAILTIAGGLAFGLWAFPLVVVGATTGAAGAFLAGRYLLRERVEAAIEDYPKFKAVDSAINDEGWRVVGLLRLSPAIPFALQNWFLGTTKVGFIPYVLATFFGIMPGVLLYVWIGSLGAGAGDDSSWAKYAFYAVGLAATIAVTVLVGRKAKAKLDEHA